MAQGPELPGEIRGKTWWPGVLLGVGVSCHAAFQQFKDKNFTVFGVSLDREKSNWVKAIKDDGLNWSQVSDLKFWQNEAAAKYKVQSIPQNFLIDPNGKIIARNLRGAALDQKLCEVLGCQN